VALIYLQAWSVLLCMHRNAVEQSYSTWCEMPCGKHSMCVIIVTNVSRSVKMKSPAKSDSEHEIVRSYYYMICMSFFQLLPDRS